MNDSLGTTAVVDSEGTYGGISQQNTNAITTTGKINGALTFNGTSDHVVSDSIATNATENGSISCWFNADAFSNQQVLFAFGATDGSFVCARLDTTQRPHIYLKNGAAYPWQIKNNNIPSLNTGQWYHLVVSGGTGGAEVYLDGILIGSDSNTEWAADVSPNKFTLGSMRYQAFSNIWYFDGDIDDTRVFDAKLTSTEVLALYNSGVGTEDNEGDYLETLLVTEGISTSELLAYNIQVGNNITILGDTASTENDGDITKDDSGNILVHSDDTSRNLTYASQKTVSFAIYDSDVSVATGDGKHAFTVPKSMATMVLTDVVTSVHTKGITGSTDIQVRRRRSGSDADMLSTKITVGDEYFATDEVVNTSNDDVNTGDQIYIDVDAIHSGTAPLGLSVVLMFEEE